MVRVNMQKWEQSLDDLRRLALQAPHPRTRERFLALSMIADGTHNATTWAARYGRQDDTVLQWVHLYNEEGPDALTYRRTGGLPPFAPKDAEAIVKVVLETEPVDHDLPGHGWTLKKLRQWVIDHLGRTMSRNAIRRILKVAKLSYKRFKKLLGKANPTKRAAHMTELEALFAEVLRGEVTLIYIDESHFHQDMDQGYTWGLIGERSWRVSTTPGLSERLNWYGAYDFTHGQCLIWEDGPCNGNQTCYFLDLVAKWRAGIAGRLVVIWDNAPSHIAKVVQDHAAERKITLVALPGYSPDLNPIERLWDWMRDEVTRGHCHSSLPALRSRCHQFIASINTDPRGVVDRLWPKFELDPEYEAKLAAAEAARRPSRAKSETDSMEREELPVST